MNRSNYWKSTLWRTFSLSLLCAIAGIGNFLNAASVTGTVRDPDGLVVEKAEITFHNRTHSTTHTAATGTDGHFTIRIPQPGEYLVEAHSPDRMLQISQNVAIGAETTLTLDLTLALQPVSASVVIAATATPLSLQESAKAASVVTAEEIERRDEYSLVESLRLVPGVRIRQIGGPGAQASVSIRGLRTTDTAVLVDGMRMRDATDPQGSAITFYENLLWTNADQVEVIRGSGSSLYGSHAIGGVVNLVSQAGGGTPHADLLMEGGGLGMMRGLARGSGSALGNRLGWSGGITHLNVTRGVLDESPIRNTTASGFAQYQLTSTLFLTGRVMAADVWTRLRDDPFVPQSLAANLPASGLIAARPLDRDQSLRIGQGLEIAPGQATFVPSPADPDFSRSSEFYNAAVALLHQIRPSVSYRISYQLVDSHRRFQDAPQGVRFEPQFANDSRFAGRIDTVQSRLDAALGRWHLITGGYEYERERYRNRNLDSNPDPTQRTNDYTELEQTSHSVFLQDQMRLFTDDLRLSLSGRAQFFDLDQPTFTGGPSPFAGRAFGSPTEAYTADAALSYYIRPTGTKLRSHVGNAYRAPSPFERFGASFYLGFADVFGDPGLRPERTLGIDAGIDQSLFDAKLWLSATWFYTSLREVIVFDFSGLVDPATDPWGRFYGYLNIRGGISRGGEFSATSTPWRGGRIAANYTYTRSDPKTGAAQQVDLFRAINAPAHMGSLLVSQWIGKRLNLTLDFARTGSYFAVLGTPGGSRGYRFDGIAKADLVGSYQIPVTDAAALRLFGKVENLTDQRYFEAGFYTPGRWAIGGIALQF